MPPVTPFTPSTAVARALRRRCPWCGGAGIFSGWFAIREACPTCGYGFEREEGYWVGAMIMNMAVIEIVFGVLIVGGIALTYPDVPWGPLLGVGLALMVIVPIVFYPISKAVWIAVDLIIHPHGGQPDGAFAQRSDAGTTPV